MRKGKKRKDSHRDDIEEQAPTPKMFKVMPNIDTWDKRNMV